MMEHRTALLFAPLAHTVDDLLARFARQDWLDRVPVHGENTWVASRTQIRIDTVRTVQEARERLAAHYYNVLLIDCRHLAHDERDPAHQLEQAEALLRSVLNEGDRERRYPAGRVVALVGDPSLERTDELLFALGERHLGGFVRDRSLNPRLNAEERRSAEDRFVRDIWSLIRGLLGRRRGGRKALCASGGGITGIFYELGVLKCMNDAFGAVDVRDFDLYYGISAGAIVTSLLANGYHIDEIIENMGGRRGRDDMRMRLGVRNLNVAEVGARAGRAMRSSLHWLGDVVRGRDDFSAGALVNQYAALFGPIFQNAQLEERLRDLFDRPGRTNDFRHLKRSLYIGATDQDRREHVLFGDEEHAHVPISRAVQASTAIHPFFRSVEIDGRFYTDGFVTRTSNLGDAIDRGADLIFVIDPFLPLISEVPGHNARQGNLRVIEQDFKTISWTRYEQVSDQLLRRHPGVNAYTFVPSNRMREWMAQNPLGSKNFDIIVCEAYKSTGRRLEQLAYKLSGELAAHGITLDLDPVRRRVSMLTQAGEPDLGLLLDEA